ncbi:MAG: DUF4402 domain-containing protein [Deferrisomatales bacterium]|nr:DUF4402 domain-containing protein [Deferrisomatales bacterium]
MTRKITLIALVATGSLLFAGSALAATGTASASVEILAPLTVVKVLDMEFGTIAPPSIGNQDFVLATGGGVTPGPGDGAYFDGAQPAQFTVSGSTDETVGLNLTVTSPMDGTGVTLETANLVSNPGDTLLLDGTAQPINIGGTLNVASNASVGAHTATIQLEVLYQ